MPDSSAEGTNQLVSARVESDVLIVTFAVSEIREAEVSNRLRDDISSMLDGSPVRNVVLDMGSVGFIGSIGILVLLAVHRRIKPDGGRLVLCSVARPIQDMLAACRLAPSDDSDSAPFEIADNLEAALGQFDG